jgi:putative ATPase
MRPAKLDEYVGQDHLVGASGPIAQAIAADQIHSMIFWGPPGCGKTTLAQLISHETKSHFLTISAVTGGVKDIRNAVAQAELYQAQGSSTILFIDEIHRFNKSQQDALLPYVEEGLFVLIGATTENPSFELNNALLSRARVYIIKPIAEENLLTLIDRTLADAERGVGKRKLSFDDDTRQILVQMADGDARRLLNLIEVVANHFEDHKITADEFKAVAGEKLRQFDKGGEYFYDQISALHKAVRGSDPDASLYWLCRMIDGGVDPNYIARRLVRMASEDIGNADPRALDLANNAWDALLKLGAEEGNLALAQAVVYLAAAPKSNAVYVAYKQAMADVKADGSHDVPVHLRNAPTKLMKELGYGKSYQYAHDYPDAYVPNENYWPETKAQVNYYQPVNRGLEIQIQQKLQRLREIDGKS